MVKVLIRVKGNYPVDPAHLRLVVKQALRLKKLAGRLELSVVIVSKALMVKLNQQYRQQTGPTDVLSFGLDEIDPDGVRRLGEIVISYPVAKHQALTNGLSVRTEIDNLVRHGLNHLLGIHHK